MTNGLALQRIKEYYGKKSSWPDVGRAVAQDALKNGQIHAVTERDVNRYQALSHALYHGRVKHSPTLRRALGIPPETEPVPVCENCNHVHELKATCPHELQKARTTKDYTVSFHLDDEALAVALRAILDAHGRNRQEIAEKIVNGELRFVEGEQP